MDENEQEIAAEQEAVKEVKEEEVRAAIIAEFGFDEVDDAERIDKLVAKDIESRKKLSTAIGQKRKWRDEAQKPKTPPAPPPPVEKPATEDVGTAVSKELDKRDLASLDYPAELKKEIERIAQAQGVSVQQALRDPYIAFKIDAHEKAKKAEEAAITRTNRSGGKNNWSADVPPKVDMSTAEGQKEYDEWKKWAIAQGK